MTTLHPTSKKSLRFRTQHTHSTIVTEAEKLRRLRTWKHWRSYGIKGAALVKKTKMTHSQVKKLADEMKFDLGGLI